MSVFNGGEYLKGAIDSILAQTFTDFEFIIIDDCSTDDSWQIIQNYAANDIRIVPLHNTKNIGLAASLNKGIKKARSPLIIRMDHDDESLPNRLEVLYQFMNKHPKVAVAGSLVYHMGSKKKFDHIVDVPTDPTEIKTKLLNLINPVYHPSAIFRKKIILDCGGYRNEFKNSEDYDLWLRVCQNHKITNVGIPLLRYRLSVNGQTVRKKWQQLYYVYLAYETNKNPHLDKNKIKKFALRDLNSHDKKDFLYHQYKHYLHEIISLRQYADALNLMTKIPADIGIFRSFVFTAKTILKFCKKRLAQPHPSDVQLSSRRILFGLPYLVMGGGTKRFSAIARLLKKHKYQIHIFTTVAFQNSDLLDISESFTDITDHIYHLPVLFEKNEDYRKFIFSYIEKNRIGTLLLGGSDLFYDLLPQIKRKFPAIRVIDQQFNMANHFVSNRKYSRFIDFTIAENDQIAQSLVNDFGDDPQKVAVIPNGVDINEFSAVKIKANRPKYIPPGQKVVSFIGRLSAEKGPDIFIKITRRFTDNPKVSFILAGMGPEGENCRRLIKNMHIKNISLPGVIDPKVCLKHTDVLLVPSRLDGRPNIILEALAMGVPVIAANVGNISQIITDDQTGYVCSTPNQMAQKLKFLLNHPKKLSQMKKQATLYAQKNLDDRVLLQNYLPIFSNHDSLK